MGAVDNDTLQAEIERSLQGLKDQPKHTKDQQLIVRKTIELYLVAFKFYDSDRTRALVHQNYKQHSNMATSDRQDSILEVAQLMKSIAAKKWKGDGEPRFFIDVKRILVDGEYVVCQVHGRRWEGDIGEHVFDMYRYRDGQFVEHWDVQMEVPPTGVNGSGNSVF